MKLAAYLKKHELSLGEFARRIKVKNARTVQRYTKHSRVPSGQVMANIQAETGGAVTAVDFLADAGS